MPTVTKIVNFDYDDVKNVILTQNGSEEDYGEIRIMKRVPGQRSEYYYDRSDESDVNTYGYVFLSSDEEVQSDTPFTKLARVSDIVFDTGIKTLKFKYDIVDGEIEFSEEEIPFDLDGQYSNIAKHNEMHVTYNNRDNWDIHFNYDLSVDDIEYGENEDPITPVGDYTSNIKFIPTPNGFGIDNYNMKLNTLATYFTDSGLVLGCLYESDGDYYYLIKYSNPSGRNRCIKLPRELGEEYEKSGIFQLVEVFDNIVICTGNNLYTYNIMETNYVPEILVGSNRTSTDSTYKSNIFNLQSQIDSEKVIVSNFRDTIDNQYTGSGEPEENKLENFYAFYLPMDMDYCKLFFAIKLNTYNCYEFHAGNLLAIYNLDNSDEEDSGRQLHYIHSSEPENGSTLSYEEFMTHVISNIGIKEGKEYGGDGEDSLVNDTSPYTNYNSTITSDLRKDEQYLLAELYLTLKHGVNCTNGHGDLLAKFKYFRVLESGLCKFTKNSKDELIIIVYSNVLTNLKKYIFKLGYIDDNEDLNTLKLGDIDNIYVQLSNEKFVINWLNSEEIYSTKILDIKNPISENQDKIVLEKDSKFYMLYKDSEFTVDNKLDVDNIDSGE